MCRIIDHLANERGMKTDDANYIFTCISDHLVNIIPALKQVIEDVFADEAGDDKLREHISKMIMLLQQHAMETFKTWQMPEQCIIRPSGSDQIL